MVNVFSFKTAAILSALVASASAQLETVKLTNPYGSTAEVTLFGAHVTSFRAAMDPNLDILFMSKESFMDGVKPISGGIPIVFPNFASAEGLPFHGFARTTEWTLASYENSVSQDIPSVATFTMASSNSTRTMWPADFELEYEVKLYANELHTALRVHNTFTKEIEFHVLLHNYLWVDDVRNKGVQLQGFNGLDYFDKVAQANKTETREYIDLTTKIDNVYRNAPETLSVYIKGINTVDRTVAVTKSGFISDPAKQDPVNTETDTVLWNPWAEGAKTMEDFGDEEYKNMVAVEPGRVTEKQRLPVGQTYTLQQSIAVFSL